MSCEKEDGMNGAPQSVIRARLCREYAGFSLDVDLTLPGRGVTALFGHSGSGKTTCLRLIAGLERSSGVRLEVNGEIWQDDSRGIFVPVHRRAFGYVFQDAALFPHLTVAQNLAYGKKRRAPDAVDDGALVALLGIGHLLARRPQTLSGGERQRVAVARALLAAPRLLLMDEPLAALDLARKAEILPYLERLCDTLEIPVIYVSHSPEEVMRLADHLVLLESGRVVADGPLADTISRLDLPAGFFDDTSVLIEGEIASYDSEYHLGALRFSGGELSIPVPDGGSQIGRKLRVRIKAGDISLTLERATATSISNILAVTVAEVVQSSVPGHVLVGLVADGGSRFAARITRRSCERLGLCPGLRVWAQIKAVAVVV
ncbi:MAG: molybdenum ABC transporter ATP-binding protein [Puniceicoccales bacterium]|jgi:molybdate transport system ATP-binding protein|nr:molybdenum ABC transporter ATP-binding protein [Puniceicoccales bacterium]